MVENFLCRFFIPKVLNFIGNKPNFLCTSINKQSTIALLNKDKSPSQVFFKYFDLLKDPQEISKIKYKFAAKIVQKSFKILQIRFNI